MNELHKVEYRLNPETHRPQIYVDGEEIHRVRGVEFTQSVDTIPTAKIEVISEFEMNGEMAVEYVTAVDKVREEMCSNYCRYIKGMGVCGNCPLKGL